MKRISMSSATLICFTEVVTGSLTTIEALGLLWNILRTLLSILYLDSRRFDMHLHSGCNPLLNETLVWFPRPPHSWASTDRHSSQRAYMASWGSTPTAHPPITPVQGAIGIFFTTQYRYRLVAAPTTAPKLTRQETSRGIWALSNCTWLRSCVLLTTASLPISLASLLILTQWSRFITRESASWRLAIWPLSLLRHSIALLITLTSGVCRRIHQQLSWEQHIYTASVSQATQPRHERAPLQRHNPTTHQLNPSIPKALLNHIALHHCPPFNWPTILLTRFLPRQHHQQS